MKVPTTGAGGDWLLRLRTAIPRSLQSGARQKWFRCWRADAMEKAARFFQNSSMRLVACAALPLPMSNQRKTHRILRLVDLCFHLLRCGVAQLVPALGTALLADRSSL